jgi:5'-nucleotidase
MSAKERLIVDMDGVLANVYEQFLNFEEKEFGFRQPMENLMGKTEAEVFKNERVYVHAKGFFRTAPVMQGSVEAMRSLNEKYALFIVSAAMEFPNSLAEKHAWLGEHFPFITWQQIVFCGSKTVIKGDIMIDDYFRNLDPFEGRTILFSQPHNAAMEQGRHIRVNTWAEIMKLL